jgi:hypothetical protein
MVEVLTIDRPRKENVSSPPRHRQTVPGRARAQAAIVRPDRDPGGMSCGEKVCVDPADFKSGQVMPPDEIQYLIVGRDRQGRELAEQVNSRTLSGLGSIDQ